MYNNDPFVGQPVTVTYKDELGNTVTSLEISAGGQAMVCAQEGSVSNIPGVQVIKGDLCATQPNTGGGSTSGGSGNNSGPLGGGSGRDIPVPGDGDVVVDYNDLNIKNER